MLWDDALDAWVLTRYVDVAAALNDPRLTRGSTPEQDAGELRRLTEHGQQDEWPLHRLLAKMLLFSDPPNHTRLRALAHKAFTPRMIAALRPRIQAVVDSILDAVQPAGRLDVVADLAYPLPVIVISDMLDLPHDMRAQFKAWSDDIIAFSARMEDDPEQTERALRSILDLTAYFRTLVARLRAHPTGSLLSALVAAEERGDNLSEEELLANAVLLLMNGHETTTFMIANGLLALLRNPDQLKHLRDAPALIASAVDELLRYDSSVQLRGLTAADDIDIDGRRIRAGQTVLLAIGAANRDPSRYAEPDRLDIGRPDIQHLAFGRGIHYCIAAALARAELEITIGTLLRRVPALRLAAEPLAWQSIPIFRGPTALTVTF